MPSAIDKATTSSNGVLPDGSPHRSRRASLKVLKKNVQQVVLGNLAFETWYYSPYPDNIIHEPVTNGTSVNVHSHTNGHHLHVAKSTEEPVCPKLFVCPCCFKYTPHQAKFTQHLVHHRQLRESGQEHDKPVPEHSTAVYDHNGYAVYEIDGEKEKLYCQNLSLFGKLFLEQKSVFFDTSLFKYYALTYTSKASSPIATAAKGRGRRQRSSSNADVDEDDPIYRTRVLGFFSKENLSWDANNLACILVFPPFQHRQLGQLLMAVSYKLSAWEWEGGIIGGPEKPLSAMGRKSYLRFWSERIARFMMGQSADADAHVVFENKKGRVRKTVQPRKEEMTVKEIGDRTGMLGEDVAAALTEMGVCQVKYPKKKKKQPAPEVNGNGASHAQQSGAENEVEDAAVMVIQRSKVLEWAEKNGVGLISPVEEEGFQGEWAPSDRSESDRSGDSAEGSQA
jgi:hypothetical protein